MPLIFTSKPSLDFIENRRIVRLIPSLQRTLFKCYGNSLEALPFDATQLNFRLTNSTFLTNNNEICYTTIHAFTGKLAQSCCGNLCEQRNTLFSENNWPKLLLKRVQQTVHAIINTSFEKEWHYSVGDVSLTVLHENRTKFDAARKLSVIATSQNNLYLSCSNDQTVSRIKFVVPNGILYIMSSQNKNLVLLETPLCGTTSCCMDF